MISIVIPSYLHLSDCLRPCLESLKKHTNLSDVEIIVVLNGCGDDGSREFVESLGEPFRYVWLDEPSGYTHSTNVGIREAKGEYIVLLNNDTVILGEQWISLLLQPFLDDPSVGISGPLMLHCPDADEDFLVFFCAMFRRECLEAVGGELDESYAPGYGEDCDAAIQARRKGWKVVQVPPSQPQLVDKGCEDLPQWKRDKMWHNPFPIYHDGNKTFGDDHEAFDVILNRNKKILRDRYGSQGVFVNSTTKAPTGMCNCGFPLQNGVCIPCIEKRDDLKLARASWIDGWFGVDEGHWLASRVKELPKGSKVLEIGSWHCRSSRFIADNLPKDGQLYCCDTWIGSSGEPEMHGSAHQDRGDHAAQWWWCNAVDHIIAGRVVPVRMHSENAAHTFAHLIEKGEMEKFDLIFIDGDHSAEGIKTDVEAWLPLLKDDGLMCGHDYYKEGEGLHWVWVRQYLETKFPQVNKAATSLWWLYPHKTHNRELEYQIKEGHYDFDANPRYAEVVEKSQRATIEKLFTDIPKDAQILDLGCGNGVSLKILREQGFTNLRGVDACEDDLPKEFDVVSMDMHSLSFPNAEFDCVYASHVLEHAYDPIQVLSEIKRVLKPNGKLIAVLPYVEVLDTEHRAKVHCGAEILGLTKPDNAETLLSVMNDAGFTNTFREEGDLREEREIYLKFDVARPHIYDCFIFNDEFDVLDIRLATLYGTVDRFVLCEGTRTHSGKPKALHFDKNKERYAKYLNKITYVIVDDYPKFPEPADLQSRADQAWARERHQRDGILHGLQGCKDDDIILIGDADEIASPEAIKNYDPSQGLCRLKQRLFYYYLNCENKDGWDWQKIAPYKIVKELTPCGVRYPPAGDTPLIENAGNHFSFLGDAENAIKKITDYAHVEFCNDEILNKERIEQLISEGRDIFGRDLKYEFVEIDDSYPAYVRERAIELWGKQLIKMTTAEPKAEQESLTVTAEISTKDRYHLLPLTISAILNQTRKPEKLVIYDDGEQKDLRSTAPFDGLLKLADDLGIKWEIFATPKEGQVKNHQHCLDTCETTAIWRVDDDEIPEPSCLENLLAEMKDGVGAVAGLVHHPSQVVPLPPNVNGSLGDFANGGFNLQWCDWNGGPKEVQHLYSTFLYRVEAAKKAGGYPRNLSPVCHREETIFTHSMFRAGYRLIVTPFAKTYHLRGETGGIRAYNRSELWQHDEEIFQDYLRAWNVVPSNTKLVVLDAGLGDHLLYRGLLIDEFHRKHPEQQFVIATCYPEVFADLDYVTQISIADAQLLLGDQWESHHMYAWAWKNNKGGNVVNLMREFYG